MCRHEYEQGDALVFVSHKYHCVEPVPVLDVPAGAVSELSAFVTEAGGEFCRRFRSRQPVILQGMVSQWHAATAWAAPARRFDGLREAVGADTCVSCLFAHDNEHFFANALCESRDVRFGPDVVDVCLREASEGEARRYCRLRPLPPPLARAVGMGGAGAHAAGQGEDGGDGVFRRRLCACWIGSRGIVTPLHFDLCHGLLACVEGTKRVTLFPPSDTLYLYRAARDDPNPNSSRVHWERWRDGVGSERARFPKMAEASPVVVSLSAGQALYTPPGWWHTVEGLTPTVAVLLPFDMTAAESLHPSLMY
eukprot:g6266.t1